MNRRTLLKLLPTFLLSFVLPGFIARLKQLNALTPEEQTVHHLLGLMTNLNHAKVIGTAYLQTRAQISTGFSLAASLCSQCPGGTAKLAQMNQREFQQWLHDRQTADFIQGRTVNVQGWVLSQTEAELCALAALA